MDLSHQFDQNQSPNKLGESNTKERTLEKDDNINCFRDMTLSSSSKSSEDFSDSISTSKKSKDGSSTKISSPIPLHPNFSAIGPYPNTFIPHLASGYPMLHPNQISALSAMMSGNNNPYTYLNPAFNPALLQAVASVGGMPNSTRFHSSNSGSNSSFPGAMGRGNYSSLLNNPQSLSAFNAYAHLLPYGAMAAAAGYSPDISALPSATAAIDLPGHSLSSLSIANRLYRQSVLTKSTGDTSSHHPISTLASSPSSVSNPLFGNAFTNNNKSRYAPYSLPPHFGFNFKSHATTFCPSNELRHSEFSRKRKPSGSASPSSSSSPLPVSRERTCSNSSDSYKSVTRKSAVTPETPIVSSAVQELRNIENMVSGLDRNRHCDNKVLSV